MCGGTVEAGDYTTKHYIGLIVPTPTTTDQYTMSMVRKRLI